MSNTSSNTTTTHKPEHGTTTSYVVGFLLSLVFTFIPYYLVVEQRISGNGLLATILGFAMLQMIVQLVFFLHLGREKKPRWQLWFLIGTVVGIVTVVGGSIWIMRHLHYNMTPVTPTDTAKKLIEDEGIPQIGGEETGACQGVHSNHKVVIKNGHVTPLSTEAQVCDTLTFINEDDATKKLFFGTPLNQDAYAGETEVSVRKGRNETITLSAPGTHTFYDSSNPKATGNFTVMPKQ